MKKLFTFSIALMFYVHSWGQWSMTTMNEEKYGMLPLNIGNKLLIVGGVKNSGSSLSNLVERYDFVTDNLSVSSTLNYAGANLSSTGCGFDLM